METPPPVPAVRLGEELPIFCEKCGYSLHGLPAARCERCDVLQFHCPECGHHQPINTLRPAFQKLLGRLRATWLVFVVFFKLNFFGWLLFAWVAMGVEWSHTYRSTPMPLIAPPAAPGRPPQPPRTTWSYTMEPRPITWEQVFAFGIFGYFFAAFGRMLLLRWRRGWAIGLVLAALVFGCVLLGSYLRLVDRNWQGQAIHADILASAGIAAGMILLGTSTVWGIWWVLVRGFLPSRTATALLEWQARQSRHPAELARE